MVDSPRRASARSKSPIVPSPSPPAEAKQENDSHSKKTAEQIAEERERRRERLLAGRDSRLTKIVSSVGGTNFTPPSNIASPANIVHATSTPARTGESEIRARPVASTEYKERPIASVAAAQAPSVCSLTSEKKSTLLIVIVNVFALVAGWYYLGRNCFKAIFNSSPLVRGECARKFEVCRKAYFGLLICTILPVFLTHLRSGNYGALVSTGFSSISLSLALLVLLGIFIDRL
jgi:hypothetical protein